MTETNPRIEAVARAEYNLRCGLAPDAESNWDELPDKHRAEPLARAAIFVAAMDAADDRVRLTLPEFHALKSDAISDLNIHLFSHLGKDQLAAGSAVTDAIEEYRASAADRYIEPVNHEAAMKSLIRERTALFEHLPVPSLDDLVHRREVVQDTR